MTGTLYPHADVERLEIELKYTLQLLSDARTERDEARRSLAEAVGRAERAETVFANAPTLPESDQAVAQLVHYAVQLKSALVVARAGLESGMPSVADLDQIDAALKIVGVNDSTAKHLPPASAAGPYCSRGRDPGWSIPIKSRRGASRA